MSISWQPAETPLLVVPPGVVSLDEAHAAIELWEHYSRKRLDPSQRLSVEVAMAQTGSNRWAASTTGREMPRQNGKGDEIEVVELWGLVQRSEAILHTVHDAVLLATQTQSRMLNVLESHQDLRRKVKRVWRGTGQQMIEMRNGGTIWYRTRTNGGGRGVDDVDRLVIDEAQHATEEHVAAASPTLLANTNPQMNAMGTAGFASSAWWWAMRKRALFPDPGAFGYVGHTAERLSVVDGRVRSEPVDVQDRGLWRLTNPSIAAGRGGGMAFLEEQLRRLGPVKFGQEHLCIWQPMPGDTAGGAFDTGQWAGLADAGAERGAAAFGVAAAPDQSWAAIAVAWVRPDSAVQVMLADYRPGTAWVDSRVAELRRTWGGGVRLSPSAKGLVEGAEAMRAGDQALADNAFARRVELRTIRHGNEPALNTAVSAAMWRQSGDVRVLDQRGSADVSPLVAASVAVQELTLGASSGGWMVGV